MAELANRYASQVVDSLSDLKYGEELSYRAVVYLDNAKKQKAEAFAANLKGTMCSVFCTDGLEAFVVLSVRHALHLLTAQSSVEHAGYWMA